MHKSSSPRHIGLRTALPVLGALWIASVVLFARYGFNPTDDGLLLAQASRLLSGDAPHSGVVSPRPLGSAVLHLLDVLLRTPLLVTSRAIALLQFVVIAALTTRLLTGRRLRDWRISDLGLTVAAYVVNLHRFPLMAWHTVDGVFVTLSSLVVLDNAVRRRSPWGLAAGAALAGAAPLMKQSFAAVPVMAGLWVCWLMAEQSRQSVPDRMSWRRAAVSFTAVLLPGVLYGAWVVDTGSIRAAADQLLSSSVEPFAGIRPHAGGVVAIAGVALALVLTVLARWRRPLGPGATDQWYTRIDIFGRSTIAVALAGGAAVSVFLGKLALTGSWGSTLWWLGALSVISALVLSARADVPGIAVLAVAWMASLSWGYPVTNLLAGSLLVLVLLNAARILPERAESGRRLQVVARSAMVLFVAATLVLGLTVRYSSTYRDVAPRQQTADLGGVASGAWGVTTNRTTAAYLSEVAECLERYPTNRLAVVPDNPVVPYLFGRSNPLPLDWWYPLEIPSDRMSLLDTVRDVGAAGDYLVLFQTVAADDLATRSQLAPARGDSEFADYPDGMSRGVFDALGGQTVTCGSFVGRYSPPT